MKKLALPFAFDLLALVPASASASVTQYATGSCTFHWHAHGDTVPFLCLTESSELGGDKLILTGNSDIANLNYTEHDPTGLCSPKTTQVIGDNWNDCISGVWAKLGNSDSFCVYRDINFHVDAISASRPSSGGTVTYSYNLPDYGVNDTPSSVMLQQSGTPCAEGGV